MKQRIPKGLYNCVIKAKRWPVFRFGGILTKCLHLYSCQWSGKNFGHILYNIKSCGNYLYAKRQGWSQFSGEINISFLSTHQNKRNGITHLKFLFLLFLETPCIFFQNCEFLMGFFHKRGNIFVWQIKIYFIFVLNT